MRGVGVYKVLRLDISDFKNMLIELSHRYLQNIRSECPHNGGLPFLSPIESKLYKLFTDKTCGLLRLGTLSALVCTHSPGEKTRTTKNNGQPFNRGSLVKWHRACDYVRLCLLMATLRQWNAFVQILNISIRYKVN